MTKTTFSEFKPNYYVILLLVLIWTPPAPAAPPRRRCLLKEGRNHTLHRKTKPEVPSPHSKRENASDRR